MLRTHWVSSGSSKLWLLLLLALIVAAIYLIPRNTQKETSSAGVNKSDKRPEREAPKLPQKQVGGATAPQAPPTAREQGTQGSPQRFPANRESASTNEEEPRPEPIRDPNFNSDPNYNPLADEPYPNNL
ncbi:MAG: hypothetical protein HY537_00925 [Deltaproteobacteria bacterium]|nr:hypothetical protein [Deltaproteobacteria bacterium]